MIGRVYALADEERDLCRIVALDRFKSNRLAGVANGRRGDQSDEATDLEGVAAEFVVYRLYGVSLRQLLDTSPRSCRKGDDGGDVVIQGRTVDVKATTLPNGRLIAAPWKHSVDCYALVTGTFPQYAFRGFMEAIELLQPGRLQDLGRGQLYVARQAELKEFEDLIFESVDRVQPVGDLTGLKGTPERFGHATQPQPTVSPLAADELDMDALDRR